jgi:signal transduction histidine kinase
MTGWSTAHKPTSPNRPARAAGWDLVISDWSMPEFDALEALAILKNSKLDLPFLIVSGTVGEETAVRALREGARDFLLVGRLTRLGVVVDRELREAAARRERARMQEQLMVSDRMASIGVLAAGVAHEINNPLAAVLANLDLALMNLDDPQLSREALRDELADARRAADRVRQIVCDLRILSRTETELRVSVDIERVMESTLRMARNEIPHRARLVRDYKPVPPIQGSEARVGQVLLNLVVNAAQALPEGRAHEHEIRVAIDTHGDRARISITDPGTGIDTEVMKHLFEPFYTTKPANLGTGLGLSICHRIVSGLGGEIYAESPPGAGATFTVLLPFADPSASHVTAQQSPPLLRAARRDCVLIVDDEPMIARAVQRAIANDHETVSMTRGCDAVELVRGGARFDVIVSRPQSANQ